MLLALVQALFRARISRQFPLTALCAVAGDGLIRRFVPVCTLIAQTQGLHF